MQCLCCLLRSSATTIDDMSSEYVYCEFIFSDFRSCCCSCRCCVIINISGAVASGAVAANVSRTVFYMVVRV